MTDDNGSITLQAIQAIRDLSEEGFAGKAGQYLENQPHLRGYLQHYLDRTVRGVTENFGAQVLGDCPMLVPYLLDSLQDAFMRGLMIYREEYKLQSCGPSSLLSFSPNDLTS